MLRSLLLSPDENAVRVIGRVFKDLEVTFEHFSDSSAAIADITNRRFDAIVIDDSIEDAAAILEKVLQLPGCGKSVRIVLAGQETTGNVEFKSRAQIIIFKPLSMDRVRHGLRAVRNLMARDRRRASRRVAAMLPARVRHGRAEVGKVLISDISDSGAAIHCEGNEFPSSGNLQLDFALPGDPDHIHVTAEKVWQNNDGAAGLHFLDMDSSARRRLSNWVKQQAALTERGARASASHAGL